MKPKAARAPIENEAENGLSNRRGTIAMARTQEPHSATAQFFINTVDNVHLDHKSKTREGWGYTVFGRVVEGMVVVDRISNVRTHTVGQFRHVPVRPIRIEHARRMATAGN
jgi:peptidyl-prolyl cis-trans isomerase B (cyclophilin B)